MRKKKKKKVENQGKSKGKRYEATDQWGSSRQKGTFPGTFVVDSFMPITFLLYINLRWDFEFRLDAWA